MPVVCLSNEQNKSSQTCMYVRITCQRIRRFGNPIVRCSLGWEWCCLTWISLPGWGINKNFQKEAWHVYWSGFSEKHNQWAVYLSILVIAESRGTQCCGPKSRTGEDPCPSSNRQTGTSGPSSYLCSMGTLRGLDGPTASTESNTNLIQKHLPRHTRE